jgi:hypothetical protein
MKAWMVVASVVAAFVLGILATLVLRGTGGHATQATSRATSRATSPATSPGATQAATTPAPTGTTEGSTPGQASGTRIETTSASYFGRPFETIEIPGRYRGVHTPRPLRVELRAPGGWTPFPLPAVTAPSGRFRAYVELGKAGRYHLRIVDPQRRRASRVLTVVVF